MSAVATKTTPFTSRHIADPNRLAHTTLIPPQHRRCTTKNDLSKAVWLEVVRPRCIAAAPMVPCLKTKFKRRVRFGSDFSGMDSALVAMKRLGVAVSAEFVSDNDPKCIAFLQKVHRPRHLFDDASVGQESKPQVDVYVNTPPCPSFSAASHQRGLADARGRLMKVGIQYAKKHKPPVWVLENVPTIATHKKFRPVLNGLVSALEKLGYLVHVKVLNASDFGLPHSRQRMFIVALLRGATVSEFRWPSASDPVPIARVLDPWCATDKAGRLPKNARQSAQVKRAYTQAYKEYGIDARVDEVIVDSHASAEFTGWRHRISPTLTRGRAISGGFWISTRGRYMSVPEMARLCGFSDSDMTQWPRQAKTVVGGMLGNCVPVHMIQAVLAAALSAVSADLSSAVSAGLSRRPAAS